MCVQVYVVQMWRSEDKSQELIPSFYQVGPGTLTQVGRHGGKYLY